MFMNIMPKFQKCVLRCGIVEDTKDKIVRFYGGLRHEMQDVVYLKELYAVNHLFLLAMLAAKKL